MGEKAFADQLLHEFNGRFQMESSNLCVIKTDVPELNRYRIGNDT